MHAVLILLLLTLFSGVVPDELRINAVALFTSVQKEEVLFVGDVLLARDIERKMDAHGEMYPFHRIDTTLGQYRHVIANFEGVIPRVHVPAPDFAMEFSVRESMASVLKKAGVTIATLANNHADDFGDESLEHTRDRLRENGIVPAGAPHVLSMEDVVYVSLERHTLAIVPIHATYSYPAHEVVERVLKEAANVSDFQIVSIHWGDEYVSTPSKAQQTFAHALVLAGADAIVGHHPHVVQSIEIFETAPIFYSLGNFVFDQYKEPETQEGLMVAAGIEENKLSFTLIPVTSMDMRGAPRVMGSSEQAVFLARLKQLSPSFSETQEHLPFATMVD